jgi:Tol biopolymer transport system component
MLFVTALLAATPGASQELRDPQESHLRNLRQLTWGGENAEAYWSPDGQELVFQSTREPYACDQIFRLAVPAAGEEVAAPGRVSTGRGRTTCAYFHDQGRRILYSSTHEADAACPPTPDRSQGYVWPLYEGYEIYSARPDGSDLRKLTDNRHYDAEATVCPRDGSIVFTSTRDGDLELYRMDGDGENVKRLTSAPGYDGGAFFSADCSQIVWRASRPAPGAELTDYQHLLAQGLVRPGKLEIWVARADGSEARQVTYLGAASFAPYFFPSGDRILFSTNHGDPRGREFDLWAVNVDGSDLERITFSPGFDGFPMFSPDGKTLAFASNRNQQSPGETNLFVAEWVASPLRAMVEPAPTDRVKADVVWLSADEREGRGVGTGGLAQAARYLATRFGEIGLAPAGRGSFEDPLEVAVEVQVAPATRLVVDEEPVAAEGFRPAAFSAQGTVAAEVVPAGYGITAPELGVDDYAELDVRDKLVVVRRFVPEGGALAEDDAQRRYSDLRYKAWNAREHGAAGLLVVDLPAGDDPPEEAGFPSLTVEAPGDAGLPVAFLGREVGRPLFAGGHRVELRVELERRLEQVANVVAKLPAGVSDPRPGAILVGAHYDHLGFGGRGSFEPDRRVPHNGADDNASGTAALLEIARLLAERREELSRDVFFVAFTAEESGLLGSTHLVRDPPPGLAVAELQAMINLDMVGRLRGNRVQVLGAESAVEWGGLLPEACHRAGLACDLGGDGYGPSDQTPFYAAGVPVLHFFTGSHEDYHKPSDDAERVNAVGIARVAALVADAVLELARRPDPLTLKQAKAPPAQGDVRSYGASLGTIPDYAGPPGGEAGVLLAGVRPGSPAEEGGLSRGDILVELAGHPIRDIHDFLFVLRQSKPGERVAAVVLRGGERVERTVVFGSNRNLR